MFVCLSVVFVFRVWVVYGGVCVCVCTCVRVCVTVPVCVCYCACVTAVLSQTEPAIISGMRAITVSSWCVLCPGLRETVDS